MAIEQTKKFGDLIKELPVKKYLTVQKILPVGGLEVRKFTNGVISFHWRYTFQGRARREPIGVYDSSSPPKSVEPTAKGYSLIAAIRRAEPYRQYARYTRPERSYSWTSPDRPWHWATFLGGPPSTIQYIAVFKLQKGIQLLVPVLEESFSPPPCPPPQLRGTLLDFIDF